MKGIKKSKYLIAATLAGMLLGAWAGHAQEAPFGTDEDIAYAEKLWQALVEAELAGDGAIRAVPYEGQHPHGAVLQTLELAKFTVDDNTGPVIVKRNYGGEGVSKEAVANDPDKYLGAVTVMYQREGYDPDNHNWFWVKYTPDGGLEKNPKGMPLAGRVAKGMDAGCIACHSTAPGEDLVFNHDRYVK